MIKSLNHFNNKHGFINNPLLIALDLDDKKRVLEMADALSEVAGAFKLGPRLCLRYGQDFVKEIAQHAPVFMDNKHFDIPSTMESAVRSSFEAGASLVTIHAQAGVVAMKKMAQLEKELNQVRPFKILAVTILTSFDSSSLPSVLKSQTIDEHVLELAQLTRDSGLTGLVCSAHELQILQKHFKKEELFLVTPGIRFELEAHQDQKRTMGPKEAMRAGASALVVGRPIIEATRPLEAATDYLSALLHLEVK